MSYSEFSRRRKSSKYNIGDKVYIYDIATRQIMSGVVVDVPDEYSVFYGVRPMSTPKDSFCQIDVLTCDMRKIKKGEVVVA